MTGDPARDRGVVPAVEPSHESDRRRAGLERRLAAGGFAILVALVVLFAAARYGTLGAVVGASVIVAGGAVLAALWLLLTALERWAARPPDD